MEPESNPPLLKAALECYEDALRSLKTSPSPSEQQVLAVLNGREYLQTLLDEGEQLSSEQHSQLEKLDRELKALEARIARTVELEALRTLVNPPENSWWWFFQATKAWWNRYSWILNTFTALLLGISLSLLTDTSKRFLIAGPDAVSTFAVVIQGALALLAGGTLLPAGQKLLEFLFSRSRRVRENWSLIGAILALSVTLVLGSFHLSLPAIARCFHDRGISHYTIGQSDSALKNYRQAIALDPNFASAHYHLGLLYEDLQQVKPAMAEYQKVVQSDPPALSDDATARQTAACLEAYNRQAEPLTASDPQREAIALHLASACPFVVWFNAHNNLGRLQIWQKKYTDAAALLKQGLIQLELYRPKLAPELIQSLEYPLLKNLGWAQWKQGLLLESTDRLEEAIQLATERPDAYCLLAQVKEARKQPDAARTDWNNCRRYAQFDSVVTQPELYEWYGLARERLN